MKYFMIMSALLAVATARPSVLQTSPLLNLQSHATASASASSSPHHLSLLRLAPIGPDGRVLDTLEVSLARAEHEAARQRIEAQLAANEQARNSLGLQRPLLSASSSASASSSSLASASPLTAGLRTLDSLEIHNAAAAAASAAQRNDQLRLAGQVTQAVQSQARQQNAVSNSAGSLLSATRLAQSLASLGPTGASSSSSVQLLESPELRQQNLLLTHDSRPLVQSNGLPLLLGSDGQLISAPLLVL